MPKKTLRLFHQSNNQLYVGEQLADVSAWKPIFSALTAPNQSCVCKSTNAVKLRTASLTTFLERLLTIKNGHATHPHEQKGNKIANYTDIEMSRDDMSTPNGPTQL